MSTRVAVVDIGSNSTRLLIADLEGERVEDELERRSTVTRLGAGVDSDGRLSEEAMNRVYDTVAQYGEQIEQCSAERRIAVLTSAVRDAANGEQFAHTIAERYGLEPHILAGEEEARLTFLGAMSERDPGDATPTLVVDIGGGSTEFVIGSGHSPSFHVSTQAGVVRQTERHIEHDPPEQPELAELAADVRETISAGVPRAHRRAVEHAIAVAGTATSLGAIAQSVEPYDPEKVQGYMLSRREIRGILNRLASVPLEQRRQTSGLHPDRAPTIIAGVVILEEVLELFGLERVEVSEHD
ncbi:MAG: Ppx/GppA family phosphatase, partial [Solirubrobacterales bacterium]|nr:Ppx/GppA family phosphatase [Solirubrobacterales bacterium]